MSNIELFIQRYNRIPEGMLNDEVIKRESIMDELYRLCNHLEMHFDIVYNFGKHTAEFINVEQSANGFAHRVYIDGEISQMVRDIIEIHIKDDPQCTFVEKSHPYIEITTSNMIRKTVGIPLYAVEEDIAQEAAWQIGNSEYRQRKAALKKYEHDGVLKNYISSYIANYSNADDMDIRKEASNRSQLCNAIEKLAKILPSKGCIIDLPSVSEWFSEFRNVAGTKHGAFIIIPFSIPEGNAPENFLLMYESLLPMHRNLIINQFNRTIVIFPSNEFADKCGITRWNALAPDTYSFAVDSAKQYKDSIKQSHPDNVPYATTHPGVNDKFIKLKAFVLFVGTVFAGYQLLNDSCNISQFLKECSAKAKEFTFNAKYSSVDTNLM